MINYCKLIWAGDIAGFGSFVHDCDKEGDNWSASIIICQMQYFIWVFLLISIKIRFSESLDIYSHASNYIIHPV